MTNTYQITLSTGRKWTVKPLPKQFFIYYGELPTSMMEQAIEAMKQGGSLSASVEQNMSADEVRKLLIFIREAVNQFCVVPRISLSPKDETEISPFDIYEEEFTELSQLAMKSSGGGRADGLNSFRQQSVETAAHRARGT